MVNVQYTALYTTGTYKIVSIVSPVYRGLCVLYLDLFCTVHIWQVYLMTKIVSIVSSVYRGLCVLYFDLFCTVYI